jgi:hypothetical protein
MLRWLSMRVWQILTTASSTNKIDGAFFIHKPVELPRGYVHVALANAITKSDLKSEFIKLLAEDNGGANCLMQTTGSKHVDMRILTTRKVEFDIEFAKAAEKGNKNGINLRGAQFM